MISPRVPPQRDRVGTVDHFLPADGRWRHCGCLERTRTAALAGHPDRARAGSVRASRRTHLLAATAARQVGLRKRREERREEVLKVNDWAE